MNAKIIGPTLSPFHIGTLFTLLVIPALYVLIAREHGAENQTVSE